MLVQHLYPLVIALSQFDPLCLGIMLVSVNTATSGLWAWRSVSTSQEELARPLTFESRRVSVFWGAGCTREGSGGWEGLPAGVGM